MTPATRPDASQKGFNRVVWRQIWLPLWLGFLMILAVMGLTLLLPAVLGRPVAVGMVADVLAILLFLFPAVICLFVLAVALLAVALYAGRLVALVVPPLITAEKVAGDVSQKAQAYTDAVNTQAAAIRAKLAPLENEMNTAFAAADPRVADVKDTDHDL